MSARIGGAWKKFSELSGVLLGKQGFSLKQRGKIYQYFTRIFLCCCETLELTVADEARFHGVERRIIKMMCSMRLVNRVSTDVFWDRVSFVVKIKDIIQTSLKWHGHVIRRDFNSQMRGAMELEITGKRKTGRR